jgi:hypothetical protein
MNETVKEILGILETGRTEVQVAAAQILGELKIKDPAVVRALGNGAARSSVLGRYALEALARINTVDSLRVVVRILCEHDSLTDQAIHLLNEAGPAAHPAVSEAFADAQPDRRLRLLQVLARSPSKDSIRPFVQSLLTPETCQIAARTILSGADALTAALQRQLREAIEAALDQPLPDVCVVASLGVASKIDPGGVRLLLQKFSGEGVSPAVRAAAVRGMAGQKLTAAQVKSFLAQLEDPAQRDVHEAIRELLSTLAEWPEGLAPVLRRLLSARQPEQRLFAMRVLRTSPLPDLVKLALKLRQHEDPRFRAVAEEVLGANRLAVEPLLRLLQTCKDPAEGRRLAALVVQQGASMQPRSVRAIAERAIKLMGGHSVAGDFLCDVAIAVGGQKLVPFLIDKAVRWRRTRRYPESLHLLAKIAGANLLDSEGRYQLALTRYLQDSLRHHGDGGGTGNAAMGFFAGLLRDGFALFDRLKKENSLEPDQVLRLATYFAETVGPERRFGQELLQHLAARNKGRAGDEARHVLRTVGS